jgi:glycosyltransferase involved in cell wall biosynthesis
MLVRYKHSTDDSVIGISPEDVADRSDEELFLGTAVQGHYIDSHRTSVSNTVFTLPYPGYDLSASPLVQAGDVINLHWVAHYQSPVTLRDLLALGKPVVWTLHDQWPFTGGCHYTAGCENYRQSCEDCPQLTDDPFNLPQAVLRDKMELFRGANLTIVTPSRWMASCAGNSRLFKDLRVEVISNSVDTDIFTPLPRGQAKQSLGLSPETIAILFVAQQGNERRKGFPQLVEAIRHCLDDVGFHSLVESDKVRLLCMGHASHDFSELGIPAVSLGYLSSGEEIGLAYAAADTFVLPSLEDNLPNTMLEAMSCGTPVVAFDAGGISDVVVDRLTGKLVPVGDVRQLADAILSLVLDPDGRELMGQKCRQMMVERYSLPVQARRYLDLYEDLHRDGKLSGETRPRSPATALEQPRHRRPAPVALDSAASLDSAVGPYFQTIYDQVLLRALKEFVTEKDYQATLAENRDLKLELAHLRSSRSWRVTKPLRRLSAIARKLKR